MFLMYFKRDEKIGELFVIILLIFKGIFFFRMIFSIEGIMYVNVVFLFMIILFIVLVVLNVEGNCKEL